MGYPARTLHGVYRPLNFVLPSNSLPLALVPAAAAAIKAAINSAKKGGAPGSRVPVLPSQASPRAMTALARRPGMSGAYYRRTGVGDVSTTVSGFTDWIKNNPGLAGAAAIAAVFLLGMGGRRATKWR